MKPRLTTLRSAVCTGRSLVTTLGRGEPVLPLQERLGVMPGSTGTIASEEKRVVSLNTLITSS